MLVIALEGPSLAGKSTLARSISERWPSIRCFADYVEMLNWERIPMFDPGSGAGQIEAFHRFMEAEAERVQTVHRESPTVVLLDRSVDTLLAHASALDAISGYNSSPIIRDRIQSMPFLHPDFEFYLDVPRDTLLQRQLLREDGGALGEFISEAFLRTSRRHFVDGRAMARELHIVPLSDCLAGIPPCVGNVVEWSLQ